MPKTMTYTNPQHSLVQDLGEDFSSSVAATKKRKRAEEQQAQNSTKHSSMNSSHLVAAMGSLNGALHTSLMTTNGSNSYNQMDQGQSSDQNGLGSNDATSTAAAALAANGLGQPGEMSFMSTGSGTDGDQVGSSFDMGMGGHGQSQHAGPYSLQNFSSPPTTNAQVQAARDAMHGNGTKPVVGSEEWHKVRKDNHKEVERRRRETINEGINELAQIVPSCDKNKGAILQAAIQHINTLKSELAQKSAALHNAGLVHEQAINAVATSNEEYKEELKKAWSRNVYLDTMLKNNGIIVDEEAGRGGTMFPANGPSVIDSRRDEVSGVAEVDRAVDEEAEAEGDVEDDESGDGANPVLK